MFVDRVVVELIAGRGGNGVVAWRREKYIPKGGPCGGNGGAGGSVILESDSQLSSLDFFRNRRILKAENGGQGGPNNRQGKKGATLTLKVPCGTIVKDSTTDEVLFDFTESGQVFEICKGGKGGLGNDFFKSPTNQAPNYATPGKAGERIEVELELKLIADVGLVGFPNAGKSTLINTLARGRAKVGAYPFTTLFPNLGFIERPSSKRIWLADIPGIISGASDNRGLGLEFLRHIERTKLILFLLDASGIDGRDPSSDLAILRKELSAYSDEILTRPFLVVLNKIDDDASQEHIKHFFKEYPKLKGKCLQISAITGEGLDQLKETICSMLPENSPLI